MPSYADSKKTSSHDRAVQASIRRFWREYERRNGDEMEEVHGELAHLQRDVLELHRKLDDVIDMIITAQGQRDG